MQVAPNSSIQFVNDEDGWLANETAVLATTDGGVLWSSTPFPGNVVNIDFVNPLDGWALTQPQGQPQEWLHTTDGGRRWAVLPPVGAPYKVDYVSPDVGWGITWTGDVRFTRDAGESWSTIAVPSPVDDICAEPGGVLWVAAADGDVFRSTDGGQSWKTTLLFSQVPVVVHVTAPTAVMLACSGATAWVDMVDFVGAGSSGGVVERTVDDGTNWLPVLGGGPNYTVPGSPSTLGAVTTFGATGPGSAWFFSSNPDTNQGEVNTTSDDGRSFQTSEPTVWLTDVVFSDALHGWALVFNGLSVGDGDHFVATSDGGMTWRTVDAIGP